MKSNSFEIIEKHPFLGLKRRHDFQYKDAQHNDVQYTGLNFDTQHKRTQYDGFKCALQQLHLVLMAWLWNSV